jgi:hypothetical protein
MTFPDYPDDMAEWIGRKNLMEKFGVSNRSTWCLWVKGGSSGARMFEESIS